MLEAAQHFGFKTSTPFLEDGEEFQKRILNAVQGHMGDNDMTDTPLRV
jgi:hypothetical protein